MKSRIASLSLLVACLAAAIPGVAQDVHNNPPGPILYNSGPFLLQGICTMLGSLQQFPNCVPPIGPANPPPANPPLNNMTADTFNLGTCTVPPNCHVTGLQFYVWMTPNDTLYTVQVAIYPNTNPPALFNFASPPAPLFTGTVTFHQTTCVTNPYGYYICYEAGSLNVTLPGNNYYYLVLSNATTLTGLTVGWDQNGANFSTAFPADYSLGTPAASHKIGTETFSLTGY